MKNVVHSLGKTLMCELPSWNLKKRRSGHISLVDVHFIFRYLLRKARDQWLCRRTNLSIFDPDRDDNITVDVAYLLELYDEIQAELHESRNDANVSSLCAPSKRQKRSHEDMAELVQWLISNRVTDIKSWMRVDNDMYDKIVATHNRLIKPALESAIFRMTNEKNADFFLVGRNYTPKTPIEQNRFYKIFKLNGYNPAKVAQLFVEWSRRELGKRNSLYLYGPATTGKTIIADSICHAVPFYGCVNWNNENFPFNDCVNKMVIWWEEGRITGKIVEAAKAILCGVTCRVDRKGHDSVEIQGTPVIITSNLDMTAVYEGNVVSYQHQQALQERLTMLRLTHRLHNGFGKITPEEVYQWFDWGNQQRFDLQDCYEFEMN